MLAPAFATPPPSSFRGHSLSTRAPATPRPRFPHVRSTTLLAVAPREERRAAEIERLTRQIETLRAAKAASADVSPPLPPVGRREEPAARKVEKEEVQAEGGVLGRLGKHGEASHFCPMSTQEWTEFMPRVVPVAGKIPGVTAEDVRRVGRLDAGPRETGLIGWTRVPEGVGEVVAIECPTDALGEADDLVAVRVETTHVAPKLGKLERDAVVVIDRDDRQFDDLKFYAWDVDGKVHIGWMARRPDEGDARIIGKVLCCVMEEDPEKKKATTCWKEEEEVY